MRYVCSICGYVYDEAKEKTPFSQLPESWTCPLCGAPKALFVPEKKAEPQRASAALVHMDEDMTKLSAGALAALCSNLARGCEKQYKDEERALFQELADAFLSASPEVPG
ncbi:MAG: hypothetical protein DBX44_08250, partial [Oscillospiraceae bacterium]